MDNNYQFKTTEPLFNAMEDKNYYQLKERLTDENLKTILQILEAVRMATDGKDVKKSLVRYAEVLLEIFIKSNDPDATINYILSEIQNAKYPFNTLKDKLNSVIDSFNSQMNDISIGQINWNYGKVGPEHVTDKLIEMISGTAGINATVADGSITGVKIANKAISSEHMADTYRFAGDWITDADASLDGLFSDGNYIVDGAVKANPLPNLALLNVEIGRTLSNNGVLRIKQTISNLTGTKPEMYIRHLNFHTGTSAFVEKQEWVKIPTGINKISDHAENFMTNYGTFDVAETDLNKIFKEGNYYINKGLNKPIDVDGILSVTSTFVSENVTANRWVEQTYTTIIGEVKVFKRVIHDRPSDPNYANKWQRDWVELTGGASNAIIQSLSNWEGKKWTSLGTSKTARIDSSYATKVAEILGLTLDNRAVSNGGISPHAGAGDTTMQAIMNLGDESDLITLEVGPNDGGFDSKNNTEGDASVYRLGSMNEVAKDYYAGRKSDTFYQYLYDAMKELSMRTTARVVIIISTQSWSGTNGRVEPIGQWYTSNRFKQQQAIREVANLFQFPVIDLQANAGLGGYFANEQTFVDPIHDSKFAADKINAPYVAQQIALINPMPEELELASDSPYRV